MLARNVLNGLYVGIGTGAQHDSGGDILSKSWVLDRESGRFDHVGMFQQRLLDFGWRDLLSASVDDVFDASNHKEITVAVQVPEVASPEPIVPKCEIGGSQIVVVTSCDCRSAQHDLSASSRRQLSSVLVEDRNLDTGRFPNPTGLAPPQRVGGALGCGF